MGDRPTFTGVRSRQAREEAITNHAEKIDRPEKVVEGRLNCSSMAKDKDSQPVQEKARVQFDFSRDSLAKLDEIVSTVNASTRAEVIRRALTLYTEVLDAETRGAKILFRERDGSLVQIMPLF